MWEYWMIESGIPLDGDDLDHQTTGERWELVSVVYAEYTRTFYYYFKCRFEN